MEIPTHPPQPGAGIHTDAFRGNKAFTRCQWPREVLRVKSSDDSSEPDGALFDLERVRSAIDERETVCLAGGFGGVRGSER